jgi:hypothetical protein
LQFQLQLHPLDTQAFAALVQTQALGVFLGESEFGDVERLTCEGRLKAEKSFLAETEKTKQKTHERFVVLVCGKKHCSGAQPREGRD